MKNFQEKLQKALEESRKLDEVKNIDTRIIKYCVKGLYENTLAIMWDGTHCRLDEEAKQTTGSRYDGERFCVSLENYEEVLEFAKKNNFKISDGATEAIENYKQSQQ